MKGFVIMKSKNSSLQEGTPEVVAKGIVQQEIDANVENVSQIQSLLDETEQKKLALERIVKLLEEAEALDNIRNDGSVVDLPVAKEMFGADLRWTDLESAKKQSDFIKEKATELFNNVQAETLKAQNTVKKNIFNLQKLKDNIKGIVTNAQSRVFSMYHAVTNFGSKVADIAKDTIHKMKDLAAKGLASEPLKLVPVKIMQAEKERYQDQIELTQSYIKEDTLKMEKLATKDLARREKILNRHNQKLMREAFKEANRNHVILEAKDVKQVGIESITCGKRTSEKIKDLDMTVTENRKLVNDLSASIGEIEVNQMKALKDLSMDLQEFEKSQQKDISNYSPLQAMTFDSTTLNIAHDKEQVIKDLAEAYNVDISKQLNNEDLTLNQMKQAVYAAEMGLSQDAIDKIVQPDIRPDKMAVMIAEEMKNTYSDTLLTELAASDKTADDIIKEEEKALAEAVQNVKEENMTLDNYKNNVESVIPETVNELHQADEQADINNSLTTEPVKVDGQEQGFVQFTASSRLPQLANSYKEMNNVFNSNKETTIDTQNAVQTQLVIDASLANEVKDILTLNGIPFEITNEEAIPEVTNEVKSVSSKLKDEIDDDLER